MKGRILALLFAERVLALVGSFENIIAPASVVFLASFYFLGALILKLFAGIGLQSNSEYIPVALQPALLLLVGFILALVLAAAGSGFRKIVFLRNVVIIGMLLDFVGYELLTSHLPLYIVLLYSHLAVLLLSLGCLRLGMIRVVVGLGFLCLIVPWVFIPIVPVFNFLTAH